MIKVAILDDYQNIFKEFVNVDNYKTKYNFTVFNQTFSNEDEAILNLKILI